MLKYGPVVFYMQYSDIEIEKKRKIIINNITLIGGVMAIALPLFTIDTSLYLNSIEKYFTYSFAIVKYWLGFVLLVILPLDCCLRFYFNQKKKSDYKEDKKRDLQLNINSFTNRYLPKLSDNISSLEALKENIENKKKHITEILAGLGRDISGDEDIKKWNALLIDINEIINKLTKQKENAYIAYKKSEMPEADYFAQIKNIEKESFDEFYNVQNKYEQLRLLTSEFMKH